MANTSAYVGIGTTAPSDKLTVGIADSGTNPRNSEVLNIFNSDTTIGASANIAFGQTGAGSVGFSRLGVIYQDRTGSSEDQDMFFGTVGAGTYGERMRITSVGNVGIGITAPAYLLDVNGSSRIRDHLTIDDSSDYQLSLVSPDSWSGINFGDSEGNDNIWFRGSTKTFSLGGAGASSATTKLHISGGLVVGEGYRSNAAPANGTIIQGNVGIGTITPGARLTVNSSDVNTMELKSANQYYGWLAFFNDSGAQTGAIGWSDAGYYGTTTTNGLAFRSANGYSFVNSTNGPIFTMTDAKNVGIGATAPTSKLEVVGTLNVTSAGGSLQVDSSGNVNIGL